MGARRGRACRLRGKGGLGTHPARVEILNNTRAGALRAALDDIILEDVKALLRIGKGSPLFLERIRRAAEQGEVISHYERSYVSELARKHLGPGHGAPPPEQPSRPRQQQPAPPGAVAGQLVRAPAPRPPAVPAAGRARLPVRLVRPLFATRRRMIITAIVALLVAGGAASAAITYLSDDAAPEPDDAPPVPPGLTVEADATMFAAGDIVSVSGSSASPAGAVTLAITNGDGELIWQEVVGARADRSYATLTIAGGPGWEAPGLYVLSASEGSETRTFAFDFRLAG